jgi:hypothetical protein
MMEENREQSTGEEIRISNFSQILAYIFVTVVVVGSMISILFF